MCRGLGVGYACVLLDRPAGMLEARVSTHAGDEVPSRCLPVGPGVRETLCHHAAAGCVWVVVLPLLSTDCDIALESPSGEKGRLRFSARGSKLQSRLLTLRHPQVASAIRGIERRASGATASLSVREVWPKGDDVAVWRLGATFPEEGASGPELEVLSSDASRQVHARWHLLEDQLVRDAVGSRRVMSFSLELPRNLDHFCVVVRVGERSCFAGMHPNVAASHWARTNERLGAAYADPAYERWFEAHRATDAELGRQRRDWRDSLGPDAPLVSLVMPVYRTPASFLSEAVGSVLAQSYPNWELVLVNASGPCDSVDQVLGAIDDPRIKVVEVENRSIAENTNAGIAAATGDYVGFMDHDDVLEGDCLWCYAQEVASNPEVDLLYCDEDRLRDGHLHGPAFKSPPSLTKLHGHNYVTHLLMVSRRVLDLTERSGADVAGAQDFDLTLKAFEVARDVVRVPRVLYHWREHGGSTAGGGDQKPYAHVAGRIALERHLARRGLVASVGDGPLPYTYRVRYDLGEEPPLVSVIVPNRDHAGLLGRCARSLLDRTDYPRLELLVVENGSCDQETFDLYESLRQDPRVRVVSWQPRHEGEFNYSAIVNLGASHALGDVLLFLNNDTEVIDSSWMSELVGELGRPEVGVVGAKLLYEDDLVQHAGMVANANCDFAHVNQNLAVDALGYGYSAGLPGDFSMVTGACQAVRREVFDELGGYDEELAVGFNDGDFCLRAREAGYVVAYTPYARLRHREFSSRGRESVDVGMRQRYLSEKALVVRKHPGFFAKGDPAVDPNLDSFSDYFQLRHDEA